MRVLTHLAHDHNLWLVTLAAAVCVIGSYVSVKLFHRTLSDRGPSRYYWCFVSSITAGAAIWATHFIAMLGYYPPAPVSFDGPLTILSALIAVVGTAIGLLVALDRRRRIAGWIGGGIVGLSIAAMHFVGMRAYEVDGLVSWLPEYVVASTLISVGLVALLIARIGKAQALAGSIKATGILASAIVLLHFIAMAGFVITPVAGADTGIDENAYSSMATAVALVAFLIVGGGISTHLMELRAQKIARAKLRHMALHDPLTQISNRRSFTDALERECRHLDQGGRPFALFVIDLDRFKPINETLGHAIGDEVLRRVAGRLKSAVRRGNRIARTGGDEFAVLAKGIETEEDAQALGDHIVELISRPYVVNGHVAEISACVGFTLAPEHGATAQKLMHRTEVALNASKAVERGHVLPFRPELSEALDRRRQLEADLKKACRRDDFHVVYQPITDATTGDISSAEALIRWTNDERGAVSPAEFIPVAEDLGLISRIGTSVLRRACIDAASWPGHIGVSVNISPVQLLDPRLSQTVRQALEVSGLEPSRLELEITETALLVNDDAVMRILAKLRLMGVRISLDDFGTGFSSLTYLHRFPISRIKIDKSFVQQLPGDNDSVSIISAITQLGRSMDMKITAEGIETPEQMQFVSRMGCHNLQGFLISRPLESNQLVELAEGRGGRSVA